MPTNKNRVRIRHETTVLESSNGAIAVDKKIAPLLRQCWRLGLRTRASCQGDPEPQPGEAAIGGALVDHPMARKAYIMFECRLHAALFAALAGPCSWGTRVTAARRNQATQLEAQFHDWVLRDVAVRFPHRELRPVLRALTRQPKLINQLVLDAGFEARRV